MTRLAGLLRGLRLSAAALVAAGALVWLTGSPASAHASLLSTDPADGAVLAAAPSQVVLTFNEHIGLDSVQAFTADGSRWAVTAEAQDQRLVVTPTADPGTGTLLVAWKVVSADGHVVGGSLSFSVGAPGTKAGAAAATGAAAEQVPTSTAVARWAALVLAVVGLLATVALGLLGRGRERDLAWDVGLAAAVLLLPLHGLAEAGRGLGGLLDWVSWLDGATEVSGLALVAAYAVVAAVRGTARRVLVTGATGLAGLLVVAAVSTWPAAATPPTAAVPVTPAGPVVTRAALGASGTAELTVTPDGPRTVRLDLRLLDPGGAALAPYADPTVRVATPGASGIDLGDVALTGDGPGSYRAEVTVPTPGGWQASVSVRATEFDNPVAVLAFTVE